MKDKFENSIKKQLKNREIEVSENAWGRLNQMMEMEKEKSNRKLWIPISIAASLIALFGIYWLVHFNSQATTQASQPAENTIVHSNENEDTIEEKVVEILPMEEISNSNRTSVIAKVESSPKKPIEKIEKPITTEEKVEKEEVIHSIQELENDFEIDNKIAVQTDSTQKKRQNYIDPDMLLYSIENNQTLKETQSSNSRMVIIDFNK